MSDKPYIDAGDLTEWKARKWLLAMGMTAKELSCPEGVCGFQILHLPSVADELTKILDNIRQKINYMESVKISYSADRPIPVHEELEYLCKTEAVLSCAFQNVNSCQQLTLEILNRCCGGHVADEVPGFSEPKTKIPDQGME
ncbi:TPA: hypothetical protein ACGAD2_003033 [Salmonella enterica subsp. enterica serovar Newport]